MLEASSIFGSYRLLEALGEGAMGSVWRALDLRLEREVALKILKGPEEPDAGFSQQRRKALLGEAKLACQLNHPNIAHIYDAGEVDGAPYIAMELVEGRSLRAFAGAPAETGFLLSVARQAAGALHYAHQKGVVHRDIKPENLVLGEDGVLKILDFGIARRLGPGSAAMDQTAHHMTLLEHTAPGFSQGTPAYMSPEQANGLALTGASDQFSLGTLLYELATGRHPFLRDNLVETLFAVAKHQPASLRQKRRDLPEPLAGGVDRMLAKAAEDRFPDLQDFLRSLGGEASTFKVPVPVPAPPPVPEARPRRRLRWAAAGFAALLLASGGTWFWLRQRSRETPEEGGLSAARRASAEDFVKGRRVVGILPMEQLRPDPEQAWLSNSFADAMAFALVSRRDLLVLDRYKVGETMQRLGDRPGSPPRSLAELGKALRAGLLISGSYQISGDRVKLTVRSIDAEAGATLRQFQVERPLSEVLKLEEDLQERGPGELGLGGRGEVRFPAKDPRTREFYTKADQVLTEGNVDSLRLARSFYEEALKNEPDYAPAHAGLAWALEELGATTALTQGAFQESQDLFKQASTEAHRALELDPSTAQAYRALSAILLRQGDLDGAGRAALQALRLDPADSRAYDVLADAFAGLDGAENHAAARNYFEKSLALYPDNWHAHHRLAVLLQNDGDLKEALDHAQRAVALRPTAEFAYITAADVLIWLGRSGEAESQIRAGLQEMPKSSVLRSLLAYVMWERGNAGAAQAAVKELKGQWPEGSSNAVLLEGLRLDGSEGAAAMDQLYRGYAATLLGGDLSSKKHNERRVVSVNLYFMARSLAKRGFKENAKLLLDLAERLHPGKLVVARQDPAFAG